MDNNGFIEGTSFENVYSIYEFDRSLNAWLISYPDRIEIAFRTLVGLRISITSIPDILKINTAFALVGRADGRAMCLLISDFIPIARQCRSEVCPRR